MKLALLPLAILALAGCNGGSPSSTQTAPSEVTQATPADTPDRVAPVAPSEVIAPRGDENDVDPTDYLASLVPYRLFGTHKGDGVRGPAAVIADAKTWATRTYRIGDTVGRGLVVAAVDEHTVTLRAAAGSVVLSAGADRPIRFIAHKLDLAVRALGKQTYRIDLVALRQVATTVPPFEQADIYGETVLRLGAVAPDTLYAQADFQEGDLVATVGGQPVGADLERLHHALVDAQGTVVVRVVRNGVPLERTYIKQ